MARTVLSSVTIPSDYSLANQEIIYWRTSPDRGVAPILRAAQTLYEQHRHQLINLPSTELPIIDAGNTSAEWRVKTSPGADNGDQVLVFNFSVEVLGTGSATIAAGEVGGTAYPVTVSGDGDYTITPTVGDDEEYIGIYLEITGSTFSGIEVTSLSVQYQAQRTALPAGVGDDGVVPIDFDGVSALAPLSVARVRDLIGMLVRIRNRGRQVLSDGRGYVWSPQDWFLVVPSTPDRRDIALTVWVKGAGLGAATFTTPWGDISVAVIAGWSSRKISVPSGSAVRVYTISYDGPDVLSVCAYLGDM